MGEPPSKMGSSRDCSGIESLSMDVLSSSASRLQLLAKLRSLELRLGNLRRVRASQTVHKRVSTNPILYHPVSLRKLLRLALSSKPCLCFMRGNIFNCLVSHN